MAGRLNTNWHALYVQTPREDATRMDAATQSSLGDTLTLAKELGAQVFPFKGEDIVATILHFAREYRVGHIIIGKPGPLPAWKRWLSRKSMVERLILEATRGVNIVVVDTQKPGEE